MDPQGSRRAEETFFLPDMTGDPVISRKDLEFGLLERTYIFAFMAAGVEGASGRGIQGKGKGGIFLYGKGALNDRIVREMGGKVGYQ
jgi:hypothetical protein